jgi:hypothetical protein
VGNFVNLELLAHPLNWLTVFLMCLMGVMLLGMLSPEDAGQ